MKKIIAIAGLCAAMGLAGTQPAEAAIQLTLASGGSTVTVDDGGVGDANPAAGVITYIGAVGGWEFNVTTGSIVGSPNPLIDLNSVNTTLSAPQCVRGYHGRRIRRRRPLLADAARDPLGDLEWHLQLRRERHACSGAREPRAPRLGHAWCSPHGSPTPSGEGVSP